MTSDRLPGLANSLEITFFRKIATIQMLEINKIFVPNDKTDIFFPMINDFFSFQMYVFWTL